MTDSKSLKVRVTFEVDLGDIGVSTLSEAQGYLFQTIFQELEVSTNMKLVDAWAEKDEAVREALLKTYGEDLVVIKQAMASRAVQLVK